MIIKIIPEENEDFEEIIIDDVFEYALACSSSGETGNNGNYRYCRIQDKNGLIGKCEALKEDIKNHDFTNTSKSNMDRD